MLPGPKAVNLNGNGPFSTRTLPASGEGFASGTVTYPEGVGSPVGALIAVPGFTAGEDSISWMGKRIASHGFVVLTLSTNLSIDIPASRGRQLVAAREWLQGLAKGPLRSILKPSKYAYSGHSMGGGGSLEAAEVDPDASAVMPLAGWNTDKDFAEVESPMLVIGCGGDLVASNGRHSNRFYSSAGGPKGKVILPGSHSCVNVSARRRTGRNMILWMKMFVQGDRRYIKPFCSGRGVQSTIC